MTWFLDLRILQSCYSFVLKKKEHFLPNKPKHGYNFTSSSIRLYISLFGCSLIWSWTGAIFSRTRTSTSFCPRWSSGCFTSNFTWFYTSSCCIGSRGFGLRSSVSRLIISPSLKINQISKKCRVELHSQVFTLHCYFEAV